MKLAVLGLGKMGSRIAEKLLLSGHQVVVWNRSTTPVEELQEKIRGNALSVTSQLTVAQSIVDAVKQLEKTRIVWSMLPAGEVTTHAIWEVASAMEEDDIIIDGGNSFFIDTEKRSLQLAEKHIRLLGVGVSGGIKAQKNGYPLMVGGDTSAYDEITPIMDSLALPHGGHAYFGKGGAGHFVKMVHNGIEYGMMQAISEGFAVLHNSSYNFDLKKVASVWQKGTIISSFLIDCAKDALEKDNKLANLVGKIEATGEAEWLVNTAKEEGVAVPIIEQSLQYRKKSLVDLKTQESFTAKMIASLRKEFGGHSVKLKQNTD